MRSKPELNPYLRGLGVGIVIGALIATDESFPVLPVAAGFILIFIAIGLSYKEKRDGKK